ncbi:RNA-binding transcriptional accessory protein [bacterium]|nr:RNA-binding transcriptional accessory protein [bacterium]MBU1064132.1 RNA-binding transcriptional accessory protein [bacterium]MBU1634888.1 RNA-binding transcriptional accessory protein [bacterium]MBU1872669.1 RNA-binding transcriptional accessory protein [bacterium]
MTDFKMIEIVAAELQLNQHQVANTIQLLDEDNTVPFIARYRKERTGELNEDHIRNIQQRFTYLRTLEKRKETILKSIEEQGKLTPELKYKIESTAKLQNLEDIYLPYKPKKRTRATIAKEKGLQALADLILLQQTTTGTPEDYAKKFINPEKEVNSIQDALAGACDIVAETISENADIRKKIREFTFETGLIITTVRDDSLTSVFEMYYDYSEPVKKIPSHRILAINRGEKENILKVAVDLDIDRILTIIQAVIIKNKESVFNDYLVGTIEDAYKRLISPAIEREIRHLLSESAEEQAIRVFATNLKNLLLQAPVSGKVILGIDPGFRTGSKLAVIDQTGKYLEGTTIYPHPPQNRFDEAKQIITRLIIKHSVDIIAIGNGTASRETEFLVAELIAELPGDQTVNYIIVNEAGASVYSASKIAQDEFPNLEASLRGNISIARRLLDPLAELVKIDPKSIGVGQYQHDVNQKNLHESLHAVVEDCVNQVGVNLNTASKSLLTYISGLSSRTAENIVKFREEKGAFQNREELKKVAGIGMNSFEQSAGFLRIPGGLNPLDNTSIHPESYNATRSLLKKLAIEDIHQGGKSLLSQIKSQPGEIRHLAEDLQIGEPTLRDILESLEKPGRDPREDLPKPMFKSEILKIEDLQEGMILKGTVRNVVDFGAFVDIGVKQDGLVHISQMGDRFIKDPHKVLAVSDIIDVKIISIDADRGRISLSLKGLSTGKS